jgi:protein ImuB
MLPSERIRRLHKSNGAPLDAPFALVAKVRSAMRIMAVDAAARALGLTPGLTLADARARVPELLVFDDDPAADAAMLGWLADACDRYTPMVAIDAPQGLVLDLTGCWFSPLHAFVEGLGVAPCFRTAHPSPERGPPPTPPARAGGEKGKEGFSKDLQTRLTRLGLTAHLAVATTPDAALALARYGGDDVRALPVSALRVEAEVHLALRRAGLRRVGDVAALPPAPLAARFGADVPVLLDRLLGREDVRITPRRAPPEIETEARFAEPVARNDDVLATIAALVGEAAVILSERGVGGRAFMVALFRSDGHVARLGIETGQPTRDAKLLDRLFRERIDALADPLDPGFGYDLIRLAVMVVEPLAPEQLRLDGGKVAAAEMAALIDRLGVRLGRRRVRRFVPVDTHIPEQGALALPVADAPRGGTWPVPEPGEPPLRPIHLFDPPHRIEVMAEVPDGPPRRFKWRRTMHEVARHEGPERIAAEWWRRADGAGLTRDYYRVEDVRGRRFWLFRHGLYGTEKAHPDWYLHGLFA